MLLVSLVTMLACGPSVQQVCDDYATAWCQAQFACNAKVQCGDGGACASVSACAAYKENGEFNCIAAQSVCPPGTSYDTGAAEKCVQKFQNAGDAGGVSCTDVMNSVVPPECLPSAYCH